MLTRRIVLAVGLIATLSGVLQIAFRQHMETLALNITGGAFFNAYSLVLIAIGVALVWAAASKTVRVRRLVLVVGILVTAYGAFAILAPTFAQDLLAAFYFKRPDAYRVFASWLGGFTRIGVGGLLAYAGLRPPTPKTPRLGSIVPLG